MTHRISPSIHSIEMQLCVISKGVNVKSVDAIGSHPAVGLLTDVKRGYAAIIAWEYRRPIYGGLVEPNP